MNKLLIRAQIETTVLDFLLIEGNLTSKPELTLLLDTESMYIFAYAVGQSGDMDKVVVSALQRGYDAARAYSDTGQSCTIDCVSVNAAHLRSAMIKQAATDLGMTLVYTPASCGNGRIEALIHNLSAATWLHQFANDRDNSHSKDLAASELDLGRAITAHNDTPWRHQLLSPRELLHNQHMACK
ncbi:hypothetical protein PS903_02640 [Pseudomonas fluorescens]|nr:hypothetical protein PS903_02640 [Pseudomonas fluorescens]